MHPEKIREKVRRKEGRVKEIDKKKKEGQKVRRKEKEVREK